MSLGSLLSNVVAFALISEVLARMKYRFERVVVFLFVPPRPTTMSRRAEARVSAMGTKMQANRPAFPMVAVAEAVDGKVGSKGGFEVEVMSESKYTHTTCYKMEDVYYCFGQSSEARMLERESDRNGVGRGGDVRCYMLYARGRDGLCREAKSTDP